MMVEEPRSEQHPQIMVLRVEQSPNLVPPCLGACIEHPVEHQAHCGGEIIRVAGIIHKNAILRKVHGVAGWRAREQEAILTGEHRLRAYWQRVKRLGPFGKKART